MNTNGSRTLTIDAWSYFRDPVRMAELAANSLAIGSCDVVRCEPLYFRVKPPSTCLASYEMVVAGPDGERRVRFTAKSVDPSDFGAMAEKVGSRPWADDEHARASAVDTQRRIVLLRYPYDLELGSLVTLHDRKQAQRILHAELPEFPSDVWRISDSRLSVSTIRYKAEKRALLEWTTRAKHRSTGEKRAVSVFVRVYGRGLAGPMFERMRALDVAARDAGDLGVAGALAFRDDLDAVFVRRVDGELLDEVSSATERGVRLRAAGRALAAAHALEVPALATRDRSDLLYEAEASVELLEWIDTEIGTAARRRLDALRAVEPSSDGGRPATVHGDFHAEQLLFTDGRATILDFDRSFRGDAVLDLGSYRAQDLYAEIAMRRMARREDLETIVEAYEARSGRSVPPDSVDYWTAYSLLRLLPAPFRSLRAGWRAETFDLLSRFDEALGS